LREGGRVAHVFVLATLAFLTSLSWDARQDVSLPARRSDYLHGAREHSACTSLSPTFPNVYNSLQRSTITRTVNRSTSRVDGNSRALSRRWNVPSQAHGGHTIERKIPARPPRPRENHLVLLLVADPRGRRARDFRSTTRSGRRSCVFFPPSPAAYPREPSPASSRPPRRSCVRPATAAVSRLRRDASHKRRRPAFERACRRGCVRPIRGSSQSRRESSLANARDTADHRYRGRKGDDARRRDVGELRTVRKVRDTAGYRRVEEPVVPSRGLASELTGARSERRRGRRSWSADPPVASPTSTSTPTPTPTPSGGCCLSPLRRPVTRRLFHPPPRINK